MFAFSLKSVNLGGDKMEPESANRFAEPNAHRLLRTVLGVLLAVLLTGCHAVRQAQTPTGPHFGMLTYNVNWGGPRPDLAVELIRQSRADIVCLQETTPEWEHYLRTALAHEYPLMQFRSSRGRMGGGLAFLSKLEGREVAYIPSQTGWFDGWIMAFQTPAGPVQVLNVHLRPPVGRNGSWTLGGYLCTGQDRRAEMQRFFSKRQASLPTLVVGDFNDTENCAAIRYLEDQGLVPVLPQFDRHTPTWQWRWGWFTLHRRMDHILCSPELQCCSAKVVRGGASDHFPVAATFEAAVPGQKR